MKGNVQPGTELHQEITQELDQLKDRLVRVSTTIHKNPELGLKEYKSSELLCSELEKDGFEVERKVAGMDTAFRATLKGKPGGPMVALLAEYDALPEIGHACGHNLIATIALGAALSLRKVMPQLKGNLVVLGTPDEEGTGGKVTMIEHGLFKDVDAAMIVHPGNKTQVIADILAISSLEIKFKGKASHAAASPEKGINALDAVIQTFNGINALRQHVRNDVRIHGIITDGGKRPNIVPETAAAFFFVRAADRKYKNQVLTRVKKCAQGAAAATGAKLEFVVRPRGLDDMKNNTALAKTFEKYLKALGEKVQAPDPKAGKGSTDMGNVSYVVSSIHPSIAIGPKTLAGHSREFAVASVSDRGHEAMLNAAKAMALTTLDLFSDPSLMEKVRREFGKRQ
jgi:amidohydrolase